MPQYNGNYNGRRPPRRKKEKVPTAVVVIYIIAIILILAICFIIFKITLDNTQPSENVDSFESSTVSDTSVSTDKSEYSSSEESSSKTESSSDTYSTESSSSQSAQSSEESVDTNSSDTPSSSWTPVTPTAYPEDWFANDLFIGDSIFTGLYLYEYIPMDNVAAAVGYTPSKAMNSTFRASYSGSAVDYAKEKQPKRIFIMLGSNTVGAGTDADAIAKQYETFLEKLKEACPKSEIVVISIPPVTKDSSLASKSGITNGIIDNVNFMIRSFAGKYGTYFDLNSELKNTDGYFDGTYAEADGLHFKGSAYKYLLGRLYEKTKT